MTTTVTRAEGNLLTLARVAVGVIPPVDATRLLVMPTQAPALLGPAARELLTDTLSRGTALGLLRYGGWSRTPWPTPPLHFGANTIRLLQWMLATPLAELEVRPLALPGPPSPAEDFLVATLLHRLRGTGFEAALARQAEFRRWPLTVLAHAALLSQEVALDAAPAFALETLSPWLLSMRSLLARAWLSAERQKRDVRAVDQLARIGRAQGLVLKAFLDAAEPQRELAGFLIDMATQFFHRPRTADELTRSLSSEAPLRERVEARRLAGATWRALARLREWDAQHRTVRFIDDGYDVAQRLVGEWEVLGERGFAQAAALVAQLDAIG